MPYSDLVTQKEAAAILNRSVSAVSRAIKDGRLTYADSERRLLHRPGLEVKFRQRTRPRIDAPQRKAQMEATNHDFQPNAVGKEPAPVSTDYWQRLTDKLSVVLDGAPFYWQREPNPAQLRLFCRTLDELRSQVEAEGLEPEPAAGIQLFDSANYVSENQRDTKVTIPQAKSVAPSKA